MADDKAFEEFRQTILGRIEEEKTHQLLFLQTYRDAAILAGEQVQDKRLDFLDGPPDVAANAFLLDALISLTLGPVANLPIRALANKGMRGILGARAAVSKKNGVFKLAPSTDGSLKEANRIIMDSALESLIDPSKEKFEYWKKFAEEVLGVPVDVVKRKAREAATRPTPRAEGQRGSDTASVAVRRAALAWARLQEHATDMAFQQMKNQAHATTSDKPDLYDLNHLTANLFGNRSSNSSKTNEEIEKELSLFFEACIWVLHFGGTKALGEETVDRSMRLYEAQLYYDTNLLEGGRRGALLKVNRNLFQYWINRFPHPKGNGQESFAQVAKAKGTLLSPNRSGLNKPTDEDAAILDLLEWFKTLDNGLERVEARLKELGFEVLGPIKFK